MPDSIITEEIWKTIPNYPGYEVSDHGRVRSFSKKGEWVILKFKMNSTGYRRVTFKVVDLFVHHLVLAAFIGPRLEGKVCNHKNFIRTDNRPENLEYVTQKENIHHARRNGRYPILLGRNGTNAKFSIEQLNHLMSLKGTMSTRKASALTGITKSHVHYCWNGGWNGL